MLSTGDFSRQNIVIFTVEYPFKSNDKMSLWHYFSEYVHVIQVIGLENTTLYIIV